MKLKNNFSLKKLILGEPHYKSINVITAFIISAMAGVILYLIGLSAHAFIGDTYQITATYSGMTFAILIFILLITNKFR